MFDHLIRNIRHGIRNLVARPAFTIAAILSLAIGIGASTTLFSVIDTLLLSPVRGIGAPQDLVELGGTHNGQGFQTFSYPDFEDFTAQSKSFAELFAYRLEALNVGGTGLPQRAMGLLVSGNYFDALKVPAWRGRMLGTNDARAGAPPVAVATYAAWRKYFNDDESIVGKPVSINGSMFTLVGVAPREFRGTIALISPEFFVPVTQRPLLLPASKRLLDQRESSWLMLGARLADGATSAIAQTRLSAISSQLAREYPPSLRSDHARNAVTATPLRGVPGEMRGGLMAFSGVLTVLILLILLVACVNVASMLLARGESRRHEIAVRFALGASRRSVIAQLMTESALLSLAAGTTGVLLSIWTCQLLAHVDLPTPIPIAIDIPVSANALLFALACSAVTALVFGLLPALRVSRSAPKAGNALVGRQVTGSRSRLAGALVVAQVAFTMVLLISGGLFARALQRAAEIDPGFDPQKLLAADFNLEPSGYVEERQLQAQQQLVSKVQIIPGVSHAALTALVPMDLSQMEFGSFRAGKGSDQPLTPSANVVSPTYFSTLGVTVQGRAFDDHDLPSGARVCVVNAELAHLLAPDGDVLGRSFPFDSGDEAMTLTIVGVVPNGKYSSLGESTQPFMFLPLSQWPRAETSLIVETSLPAGTLATQLRDALRAVDPLLPPSQVRPMTDVLSLSLLPQRIAGMVSTALGMIGLLLVAIGLHGVIAMYVARRTREFGVRIALGASPRRVRRDVMRRGTRLLAIGLIGGVVLSAGCAMLISSLLFGATLADASVFFIAAVVLTATTLFACWLPARYAASIDPAAALRSE